MTENYTTGAQYLIQENGKTIGGCQSFDFEVSQEVEDLEEMGDLYDLGHIVTSVKVSGRMSMLFLRNASLMELGRGILPGAQTVKTLQLKPGTYTVFDRVNNEIAAVLTRVTITSYSFSSAKGAVTMIEASFRARSAQHETEPPIE